jgi:hypothetical protein
MRTFELREGWADRAAAVDAPIKKWFQIGHSWRRVTEQRRSMIRHG